MTDNPIESKLKEAEAYRRMGLYKEARSILNGLRQSETGPIEARLQARIDQQIDELRQALETMAKETPDFKDETIALLREGWTLGDANLDEILSSAEAFRELGLCGEAVAEYSKLLGTDELFESILPDLIECFLQLHPPGRVIEPLDQLVAELDLPPERQARIKFYVTEQLDALGHPDQALKLLAAVSKIAPEYEGLQQKREALVAATTYHSRYDYLLKKGIVNTGQLQNALTLSKKSNKSVESILIDSIQISREEIGKSLSLYYQLPFKTFDEKTPVPYELIRKLKKPFLLQHTWVPLTWDLNNVQVLIDDPHDLTKTDGIPGLINAKKINWVVGIREDIEKTIHLFFREEKERQDAVDQEQDEEFALLPEIDFEEESDDHEPREDVDEASGQVVRMVDQILINAYRKNASDIHIEPSVVTKKTAIRYRIDGVCQEVLAVPNTNARAILSRLKIMANMDIAERRLPQDGKIKFRRKGIKPFELRLATLPTAGAFEDAVLRILAESGAMPLDDMGMTERNLQVLKQIISQPYGLVLVVGPTGSGKTTTLHAALNHINKPGIKIWTAEDPVEITQHGLRQVEVKPKIGLDFARVMRAFLRADPDVIMIGEMRDHETAAIGLEASLTGHLVFSTLHTNSAPETVTRLLDMGLNSLNFSDAFLGVLAQRLIRRLCQKCRQAYHPSEEEFDEIVTDYSRSAFEALKIDYGPDLTLNRAVGCEECLGIGYRGRTGAHELMEGTKEIKHMIKKAAPTEELFVQAAKDGMTTIKQDGLIKVFAGLTDTGEIRRVCIS